MNLETLKTRIKQFGQKRRNQAALAILAALVVVVGVGWGVTRHNVTRGWPQTEGTLTVVGLSAPVTIVRDGRGVAHIYAENDKDLFFAQGYVHAQDRFWQMETSRQRGRGELGALVGPSAAADDAAWRALDLITLAGRDLARMKAATRAPLDAYAAGVNAWLETHRGRLPFEFTLLGWRGQKANDPAPWTPEDSLVVALVLSWQAGAPQIEPALAARIEGRVGAERGTFLLGEEPPGGTFPWTPDEPETADSLPARWALDGRVTLVPGDQTASGKALLAIDLPTGLGLPGPWYVMACHGGAEGAAGASVPGLPGLVAGTEDGETLEAWSRVQELTLGGETPLWKRRLLNVLLNSDKPLLLQADQTRLTLEHLWGRQWDTLSGRAARLIPFLLTVDPQGWRQERVTGMLDRWDYHVGDNNKEAPFFAVYQLELARAALADELGEELFQAYVARGDRYQAVLDHILQDPDDPWWDDVNTPQRELRGDILARAYEPALEWIGRNYGDLHMLWEWDLVHGSRLHHLLGDAWPWDQLLSRDFGPDGWADTVNASPGGLPCTGDICLGGDFFRARAVYGYRQLWDLDDPSTLWFALLPGQSGHPFHPHYDDLMDEWLTGTYLPLRLAPSPQEVADAQEVLVLQPPE